MSYAIDRTRTVIGQCMNPNCVDWLYQGSALKRIVNGLQHLACCQECADVVDRLIALEHLEFSNAVELPAAQA